MYAFGEFETVSNPGSNREKGTPPMKKKNIPASVASTNAYEGLEDWARSRVQVWLQELLEDEVTQFLGREKSERSADRRGYRNGHGEAATLRNDEQVRWRFDDLGSETRPIDSRVRSCRIFDGNRNSWASYFPIFTSTDWPQGTSSRQWADCLALALRCREHRSND